MRVLCSAVFSVGVWMVLLFSSQQALAMESFSINAERFTGTFLEPTHHVKRRRVATGPQQIITTHAGRVHRGTIVKEVATGYLFRNTAGRQFVIPFRNVKSIRDAAGRAPAAQPQPTAPTPQSPHTVPHTPQPNQGYRGRGYGGGGGDYGMKMMRYRMMRKSLGLSLVLNLILPFALGSWIAGDSLGGVIGLVGQIGGIALVSMAFTTPSLVFAGGLLFLMGYIVPIITVVIYVSSYNTMLRRRIFGGAPMYGKHLPITPKLAPTMPLAQWSF